MASRPRVSVIVPTHDRVGPLERCLAALAGSDLPADEFEVVVVDDGSAEDVEPTVRAAADRVAVTLLRQSRAGPAAARNRGAARAAAPLLAFTDDDCRPQPGWLGALVRAAEADPSAMIGGRTVNAVPDNPYSEASQLLVDYLYEAYLQPSGEPRFFTTNNMAVPAAAFRRMGGFEEAFDRAAGEDREFCLRWAAGGRPMRLAPDAGVLHCHELDLPGFARQHFGYGRGARLLRRVLRRDGLPSPELQSPRFYAGLLARPFDRGDRLAAVRLSLLLFLSQVLNAAGYVRGALGEIGPGAGSALVDGAA